MAKERRLSVRMIVEKTGLNKNAVYRILTEHLRMRKICAKLVPKNLSVEQKANRLEICQDLLRRLEIEPNFLHKVIIGDESWVFDYDPETLYTKNLYLQDRQLITPSTNMSWNDFEKGSSVSEGADDWVLQHNNAPTHTAL